jgi:hypothetical protein
MRRNLWYWIGTAAAVAGLAVGLTLLKTVVAQPDRGLD